MTTFAETRALLNDSNFYYIICTDMAGNYSYVNSHYQKRFGFVADNMVGKPYYITMHESDMGVCAEVAAKCFEQPDKVFPATIRKHDGNGGYIITQWEFKAMWTDDKQPAGVFCLGYDITEFITYKYALTDAQSELEKKNNALQTIAFNQSHIVRRPLANIMGLIMILKQMDIDQNMNNLLDMLMQSSIELDEVIKENVKETTV